MSFVPIGIGFPQGGYFLPGRVLKSYLTGTSTATPMYTGPDGLTSTATVLFDSNKLPTVSGSVVVPHISTTVGNVDFVLYPNQASADADTGSLVTFPDISSAVTSESGLTTTVEHKLGSDASGSNVFTLSNSYSPGNNSLAVYHNGQKLRLGASYDYTETSTTTVTLTYNPLDNDTYTFVVGAQQTTASLAASSVTYTPVGGVATNVDAQLDIFDTQLFYSDQTPQVLTGAGAVNITAKVTHIVTTGADALTLADGTEGQEKFIVMKTDGGAGTLTPTSLGNGTTITFDDVGDSAHLIFTNSAWHMVGGTATLA